MSTPSRPPSTSWPEITNHFSRFNCSSARQSFPLAAASFVGAPTRAVSTPGRSFDSTAWRLILSKSSSPPTRRSKSVCPNAWGELRAPWFGTCSRKVASHRPCGGTYSWRRRNSRTGLRVRRSRWRRHSGCFTARKPTSRIFALHWSQNLRSHQELHKT